MIIKRLLLDKIKNKLWKGKALLIFGARQTGKTTLVREITANTPDYMWFNADEHDIQAIFENASSTKFRSIFGNKKLIVIDEAQRINDIGLKLKLITDQIQEVQLIVTGSSSFELASRTSEPLTGRKKEYHLFPFSFEELAAQHGLIEEKRLITQRLLYGSYPEVINTPGEEKEVLKSLSDSYLYKDILSIDGIKKRDRILKLLQAIAFQVGSEVKYTELAQIVGINNETAEKYVELLEKTFVIFRLSSLSRNLRNELKKSRKIYFYDNGIMNAVTAQFQPVELRSDIGALWENYLMCERQKYLSYNEIWANSYFWRTHLQQEIDYIEEKDGVLRAFQFTWNPKNKTSFSKSFRDAYPEHTLKTVNNDNYEEFLMKI